MELSFIDLVSYGFSLHAKYPQIDFGMYAAFVGMGPSTFFAASVPGYTAVTPLGNGTKQEQAAGSVDLEARLVLRSHSGWCPAVVFIPISLFHVKIVCLGFREQQMTEKLCLSSCFVVFWVFFSWDGCGL